MSEETEVQEESEEFTGELFEDESSPFDLIHRVLEDISKYDGLSTSHLPPDPLLMEMEEKSIEDGKALMEVYKTRIIKDNPAMRWLEGVETILAHPRISKYNVCPSLEDQERLLDKLFDKLKGNAPRLKYEDYPNTLPEGYDEPLLAIDLETNGLDTRIQYDDDGNLIRGVEIVGVCLSVSADQGYYLPTMHTEEDGIFNWDYGLIIKFLSRCVAEFCTVYHNAQYDREVMAINGVTQFREYPYFLDTLILYYIQNVNGKNFGLKRLSENTLSRIMIEITELFQDSFSEKVEFINFQRIPATTAYIYGSCDAMNTMGLLFKVLEHPHMNVLKTQPIPVQIDHKISDSLRSLYRCGIPINVDYYVNACRDTCFRISVVESEIYEYVGKPFNIGSPKVLSSILFDTFKLKPVEGQERNKSGYFSTSEDNINKLYESNPDNRLLELVVTYRKLKNTLSKIYRKAIISSYTDSFLPYLRGQLSFQTTVAPTGRFSSSSNSGTKRQILTKITEKGNITHKYVEGDGTCGFNSQGVNSDPYIMVGAKKIKTLPTEAGIDPQTPYTDKHRADAMRSIICHKS